MIEQRNLMSREERSPLSKITNSHDLIVALITAYTLILFRAAIIKM